MVLFLNKEKPLALVVEDDENLANAFGYALEVFDVKIIYDGSAAMEWLREGNTPSVVVLDLNLPGVSGEDILTYIRAIERFSDTRVFLASANHLLSKSLRDQADLVLLKPIGFRQLQLLANRFK
ncbi:MAG: response regulator [Chloroflexi bacterium]|nr:response regulator [Chloroflexota bacterium]